MIALPKWIEVVPDERQAAARQRFLLRVLSLYATEIGRNEDFSRAVDQYPNFVSLHATQTNRRLITPEMVIKIEKHFGRDLVTRELFRPDLFLTVDAQ